MHKEGEEVHVSDEEASGGEKSIDLRVMLIISVILVVVALSVIWITGALTN